MIDDVMSQHHGSTELGELQPTPPKIKALIVPIIKKPPDKITMNMFPICFIC